MRILRNKSKVSTFALMLMLTIPVFSLAINTATALEWYPIIMANPNPVGVGQRVLVVFGFTMPTHRTPWTGYKDWTVVVTDPGGSATTYGPYKCDPTGLTYMVFNPDETGTWKIKADFPGGDALFEDPSRDNPSTVYVPAASTSEISLVVQQEALPEIPGVAYPGEYWEYPIYAENRRWHEITDNWLQPGYDSGRQFDWGSMNGPYAPYTTAPGTPHIMWTKPTLFGGLIGGPYGDDNYYTGLAYRHELMPPIIINGRLYYNEAESPNEHFVCVDMYTGETIWKKEASYPDGQGGTISGLQAKLTMGQIIELDTPNWHGGQAFLWSTDATTWAAWDPWTGGLIWTVVNATVADTDGYALGPLYGPDGEILIHYIDNEAGTITLWNSSRMLDVEIGLAGMSRQYTRMNLDWNSGIQWTISGLNIQGMGCVAYDPKDPSVLLLSNHTRGKVLGNPYVFEEVLVDVSGPGGHELWRQTRYEGDWEIVIGGRALSVEEGVYAVCRKETRQIYVYRLSDGEEIWVSDPRPNQWGYLWLGMAIIWGRVYSLGYDGEVWAHNAQTGHLDWTWGPVDAGLETPYGVYPLDGGLAFVDDVVWVFNGEHSADTPLYRGEAMYGINKDTGAGVWNISGWYQVPCYANTFIVAPNGYDGQIYCFGKGPSATTVTAAPKVVPDGSSVIIEGTVTDQSYGATGTPAIADEDMRAWMEYMYMQKPIPADAKGVQVYLDTLDPNGNWVHIGEATSDMSGTFSYMWEPEVPGKYTVIATFAGSESYWGSYAETAIGVGPPTPEFPEYPGPTEAAEYTTIDLAIIAAVVVAIIIGIVNLWALRKRA